MKVLRIETEDGVGMHSKHLIKHKQVHNIQIDHTHMLADGTERRMHPDNEPFYKHMTKEHYYGFATKAHLDIWCPPDYLGYFQANDFNIYMYEVNESDVLFGQRQLCFVRKNAKRIGVYKRNKNEMF